ncbi:MAG: hypothetical protein HY851_11830 [candidate division Zixibacteria bacterium]|nr:hypothetical protein [candidate division Zixibacteria bacterium]
MDILAHALWTNLAYWNADTSTRLWATAFGVAPDALSFGPELVRSMVSRQAKKWRKVDESTFEDINRTIPRWVFRLYDITHSIPIWSVVFFGWWWLVGSMPLAYLGWLGHILVDIPTHSKRFFPTPFLWPLSDYKFDGISWGVRWFMIANYGSLAVTYLIVMLAAWT